MKLQSLSWAVLGATLLFSATASAQTQFDWRTYLQSTPFSSDGTTHTYSEYVRCNLDGGGATPTVIQIHYSAISPASVLSRDNFVAVTTALQVVVHMRMATDSGLTYEQWVARLDCLPVTSPIGLVEAQFHFIYATDGVQIQTLDGAGTVLEQNTLMWDALFNN